MQNGILNLWPLKKLNFTNRRWRTAAILKTVKLSCLCNRLTDFDEIWHDDAHSSLTADRPFNFEFLKIQHLESIPHASTPTSIIPTKFEVDITIRCRVIAFLSAHTSRDLNLWPFNLEQLTYMAGHVPNLATKFEHPMPIRSWFMSYNVSLWLPLRMCMRPLRMRRITWSVSRGSKTITFLESPAPICLFTIQLLLGYDDD